MRTLTFPQLENGRTPFSTWLLLKNTDYTRAPLVNSVSFWIWMLLLWVLMVDAHTCIQRCDITGINVLTLIVRVDSYTHVTSDGFLRNSSWERRLIFTKPESTERCQWLIKWLQTESPSVVKPDITISLVKPRERGQTDRRTHGEATWELRPGQGHPALLTAAGASPEWPQ